MEPAILCIYFQSELLVSSDNEKSKLQGNIRKNDQERDRYTDELDSLKKNNVKYFL